MKRQNVIYREFLSVFLGVTCLVHAAVYYDTGGSVLYNSSIYDEVHVDQTVANMPGTYLTAVDGSYCTAFRTYHNARINMTGGTTNALLAYDTSSITFTHTASTTVLYAYNSGRLLITGGTVSQDIWGYNNSTIDIYGGQFKNKIYAFDNTIVTLAGSNFKVGNVPVSGYLDINALVSAGALYTNGYKYNGILTGTLADGTILNGINMIIWHEMINGVLFDGANYNFIPEPATLMLLAIGGMMLRRKK